jgi:predicted nucleic acid-binding protein
LILVDSAVWVDHFRQPEASLQELLTASLVCIHPMIVGELALGTMRNRSETLRLLADLESLPVATHDEVLYLVATHRLYGRGLSLVDAHLLASLRLSATATMWTRDRRLRSAAEELGVVASDLDSE